MITQEELKHLIHYDPETGVFTNTTNRRYATPGKTSGTIDANGYRVISINCEKFYGHRLAWLYMIGEIPENSIDHIDGNPSNNKWDNLRHSEHKENIRNCKISKNNKSGYKGVFWDKQAQKYIAKIKVNYKNIYLGRSSCPKEAHKMYCEAADKYHKEFANYGR